MVEKLENQSRMGSLAPVLHLGPCAVRSTSDIRSPPIARMGPVSVSFDGLRRSAGRISPNESPSFMLVESLIPHPHRRAGERDHRFGARC